MPWVPHLPFSPPGPLSAIHSASSMRQRMSPKFLTDPMSSSWMRRPFSIAKQTTHTFLQLLALQNRSYPSWFPGLKSPWRQESHLIFLPSSPQDTTNTQTSAASSLGQKLSEHQALGNTFVVRVVCSPPQIREFAAMGWMLVPPKILMLKP